MALPVTLPDHGGTESVAWSVSGSGNFGPFLYNGNVYVLAVNHDTDASFPGDEVMMYKATDPTSSFSEVDYSGATILRATSGTGGYNFGNIEYFDAFQYPGSPYIYVMAYVRNDASVGIKDDVRQARFCCITDTWTSFASASITYSATDKPTTWWGGITQRDDGDIIIVHPGENPTTMGGEYQEVAYSRAEVATTVTDGTTGLAFSTSGDTIIRPTGSWVTDGFSTTTTDGENIIRVRSSENGGENDGWYRVTSITTTTNTNDTLNLTDALNATNGADTTAVVFPEGLKNTTGYTLTAGVVVASTATKNDNYWYAYPVMGSSDQCHFGYVRDTDDDFYLRALSSGNALRTQRTHAGTWTNLHDAAVYDRSGTETIAFNVSNTTYYDDRIYFDHFTDDSSPTFANDDIVVNAQKSIPQFINSMVPDSANNDNLYHAGVRTGDTGIHLKEDDGTSGWSHHGDTGVDISATTIDGLSGNIYERDGDQVYAVLFDHNGTVKYDEITLYATAEALTATDISSATTVGNPAITQNHSATATGIDSQPTVGNPAITQNHSATATAISSAPTTGTPLAGEVNPLTATEISSTPTTGTPALTQEHALTATEISSGTAVESSPITQNHNLNNELVENGTFPNDISGWTDQNGTTSSWNAGRIQVDCIDNIGVTYQAVTTTENTWYRFAYDFVQKQSGGRIFLSSSGIGGSNKGVVANQVSGSFNVWMGPGETTLWISLKNSADAVVTLIYDDLSLFPVTDIDSASEVEAPSIQARAELTATAISSIPVNDTSSITQVHNLAATAISSTPELNTTSITQEHALGTPTGLSSTPVLDVTGITQNHQLAVTEVASTPVLVIPTLSELNQLTATEIAITPRTRGPVLVNDASIAGLQHYEANIAYSISTTSSVSAWHTMYGPNTNCVVCCMSFMSGDNVASPGKTYNVTYDGQAMTLGSAYTVPDLEFVSLIYYLTEPSGGNSQLSISTNDEFRNITVSLIELSGINPSDPVGNNQSSSTETVGITPKTANSIIVGVRTQKEIGQGGVTPSTDNIEIIDYQGGGS